MFLIASKTKMSNLRSKTTVKELANVKFSALTEFNRLQLPTKRHVFERMMALVIDDHVSKDAAAFQCATELIDIWTANSVYPMTQRVVKKKILNVYKLFIMLQTKSRSSRKNYQQQLDDLLEDIDLGFDIRTKDVGRAKNQENYHGVNITAEDTEFYEDNCFGPRKLYSGPPDLSLKRKQNAEKKEKEKSEKQQKKKIQNEYATWTCNRDLSHDEVVTQSSDVSPL